MIPGPGRSPGERMATHSSILAWREEAGTEEPGRLQSIGHKELCMTKQLSLLTVLWIEDYMEKCNQR